MINCGRDIATPHVISIQKEYNGKWWGREAAFPLDGACMDALQWMQITLINFSFFNTQLSS